MSRAALRSILDHVRAEPSRTWSIIVTVFGDAIQPRGGSVWLGTLLSLFNALDIADGVVRTAMSRLAADGWLTRNRVGRNSFYHLAERGEATFRDAAEHIYRADAPDWAGYFDTVLLGSGGSDAARAMLREAGFASPTPGLWIAPGGGTVAAELADAVRLRASGDHAANRALAARAWPLEEIGRAYLRFLDVFQPLADAVCAGQPMSDLDAIVARILLIHEYRRVALSDPVLPSALLPPAWPGAAARSLCSEVYPRLLPPSERWLDDNAVNESGTLPPGPAILRRFLP